MRPLLAKFYDAFADVAAVLTAWILLLFVDWFVVASASLRFFAGQWEVMSARTDVAPIAYVFLCPLAPFVVLFARFAARAPRSAWVRGALSVLAGSLAAALGYGISFGRHFHAAPVRVAFVVLLSAFGVACARALFSLPRLLTTRPALVALLSVAVTAACYWGDVYVLPRLYPAFHTALFVLAIFSAALVAGAFRTGGRMHPLGAAWALPYALFFIDLADWNRANAALVHVPNVKIVLAERSPLLGRAVMVLRTLHPDPDDDDSAVATTSSHRDESRHLDWSGKNLLVISIDALRADHVGAYGYRRPVTPNIDWFAAHGAVFDRAYCPTPHTSYSITSMMTGKYMRPLLLLGQGEDSETWAGYLRTYGYRTAAFFPPAVFFVDGERFSKFSENNFGFEYAKVEFAPAELRVTQVDAYLRDVKDEIPIFLWVHLFEPHEPYELHEEFLKSPPAPTAEIAAYDSEVSAADDAVGRLVARVRASRPNAIVIITADHGEEFGEHGGRYHGTTVYEEQVRVPLVVEGEGVKAVKVSAPVQTIDLLPTVLSALGIPRPARVRGNDLGSLLEGDTATAGFAFAETDEYALVAQGSDRLVCARRVGACSLFDVGADPEERRDTGVRPEMKAHLAELRKLLKETERGHGAFETAYSLQWPESLRRGIQGEREAAGEIVGLLDDANVNVRRKAAEVLFSLRVAEVWSGVRHACGREDDADVKRWCALIGVRTGGEDAAMAIPLLHDPKPAVRRAAGLALAARKVPAASEELVAWWQEEAPPSGRMSLPTILEVLDAIGTLRVRAAVPGLLASLPDVRARPYIAETLGILGDVAARGPLATAFAKERYVTSRPALAEALVRLGAKEELRAPLSLFAGLSPPMREAIGFAARAKLLDPAHAGFTAEPPTVKVAATLTPPTPPTLPGAAATLPGSSEGLRLIVLSAKPGGELTGDVAGESFEDGPSPDGVHIVELSGKGPGPVRVTASEPNGVAAMWLVAHTRELPPPPKEPWGLTVPAVPGP